MSYTLTPYFLRIDELQKVPGSGDEALRERLRKKETSAFRSGKKNELTIGQAVEQIVNGETLDKSHAPMYGYALELICQKLGETVEANGLESLHAGVLEEIEIVNPILEAGPPILLPQIDDFPAIGHIRLDDIKKVVARLSDDVYDHPEQEIRGFRFEFSEWLDAAVEKRGDLVVFYY